MKGSWIGPLENRCTQRPFSGVFGVFGVVGLGGHKNTRGGTVRYCPKRRQPPSLEGAFRGSEGPKPPKMPILGVLGPPKMRVPHLGYPNLGVKTPIWGGSNWVPQIGTPDLGPRRCGVLATHTRHRSACRRAQEERCAPTRRLTTLRVPRHEVPRAGTLRYRREVSSRLRRSGRLRPDISLTDCGAKTPLFACGETRNTSDGSGAASSEREKARALRAY